MSLDNSGAAVFARLYDLLFACRPAGGTAGLDGATLADIATLAGAHRESVSTCIKTDRFAGSVRTATN